MTITKELALGYHVDDRPGKLEVTATKPTRIQMDLSLAYTPGVAVPVLEIAEAIGPVLMGTRKPVHVLQRGESARHHEYRHAGGGRRPRVGR